MDDLPCDFCDCGKRDEEGRLRRGFHAEYFPLRGIEVLLKTNVVSERAPRIEIVRVPGSLYGRRKDTVLIYTEKDGKESLEVQNRGGLHTRSVHYLADQIFWVSYENITIIPPEKCK